MSNNKISGKRNNFLKLVHTSKILREAFICGNFYIIGYLEILSKGSGCLTKNFGLNKKGNIFFQDHLYEYSLNKIFGYLRPKMTHLMSNLNDYI